jgi:hypothetical protein
MEHDLNDYKEIEVDTDINHFKLLYKSQNLKNNIKYEKWLENAINYVNSKNEKCGTSYIFFINFCNNCCSQAIFEINDYSFIE